MIRRNDENKNNWNGKEGKGRGDGGRGGRGDSGAGDSSGRGDENYGNYGSNGNYGNYANYGQAPGNPSQQSHPSHLSHSSHPSPPSQQSPPQILVPRGDYRNLLSYQKTEVIYEITYRFCQRFLAKGDRTMDQMIQAARSGKQNIIEGSKAATASKETEIILTSVARASLEELLEDYRDFLRVRDLRLWDKYCRKALYARQLGMTAPLTFEIFREFTETRPPEVVANIAICLIHQANYLLDQQLKGLEGRFLKDGGIRERMTRARLQARDRQNIDGEINEKE